MFRTLRLRALVGAAAALVVVGAGAVTLPMVASAQSSQTPPAPGAAGTAASTLRDLERQALRLTVIAQVPEADRAQASQLLDRADALRQRATELRTQELQGYIDALKAGTAPSDARTQVQQKLASERSQLQSDLTTLRDDVQAFVQKVPQARALERYLGAELRASGGPGMGLGRGLGMGLGAPPADPWAGGLGRTPWGGSPRAGGRSHRDGRWGGANGYGFEMRQGFGMGRRNPAGTGGWTPASPPKTAPQNTTPPTPTPPTGGGA